MSQTGDDSIFAQRPGVHAAREEDVMCFCSEPSQCTHGADRRAVRLEF